VTVTVIVVDVTGNVAELVVDEVVVDSMVVDVVEELEVVDEVTDVELVVVVSEEMVDEDDVSDVSEVDDVDVSDVEVEEEDVEVSEVEREEVDDSEVAVDDVSSVVDVVGAADVELVKLSVVEVSRDVVGLSVDANVRDDETDSVDDGTISVELGISVDVTTEIGVMGNVAVETPGADSEEIIETTVSVSG
jgi:hypothetical protein